MLKAFEKISSEKSVTDEKTTIRFNNVSAKRKRTGPLPTAMHNVLYRGAYNVVLSSPSLSQLK